MIWILFLRLLSDLCFYFSLAAPVLTYTGGMMLWPAVLFPAVCGTAAAMLREKRRLPAILCLLPMLCFYLLPGLTLAEKILYLPAVGYVCFLTCRGAACPGYEQTASVFSLFWKIYCGYAVFLLVLQCGPVMGDSVRIAVTAAAAYVVLLRILRHDSSLRTSREVGAMNCIAVGGVLLISILLSLKPVVNAAAAALKLFWNGICAPILMGIIMLFAFLFSWVFYLFQWLASLLSGSGEEVTLDTGSMEALQEQFGMTENTEGNPVFFAVLKLLGILLVIALLILLFRRLAGRAGREPRSSVRVTEHTEPVEDAERHRIDSPFSPAGKVRAQYRRFLKLCRSCGYVPPETDTSLDIELATASVRPDEEAAQELRALYLKARYGNGADPADAARAKELLTRLQAQMKPHTIR